MECGGLQCGEMYSREVCTGKKLQEQTVVYNTTTHHTTASVAAIVMHEDLYSSLVCIVLSYYVPLIWPTTAYTAYTVYCCMYNT